MYLFYKKFWRKSASADPTLGFLEEVQTTKEKELAEQRKSWMLRSHVDKSSTSAQHGASSLGKKSLMTSASKQVQLQENDPAMINHSITTRGVKRGSSMVEEDDEAEGAPLKPFSSSAAIENSGAKRAIMAKALIDLPDEKPEECAQS